MTSESPESRPLRILSTYRFSAGRANLARTTFLPSPPHWVSRISRLRSLWVAAAMIRRRRRHDIALATGDFTGFAISALQRLIPGRRIPTVLVECNWYRENRTWRRALKYWQMRFCLEAVDKCVVWAEREIQAYSKEFGVRPDKFVFVPQHTSLHPHHYSFTAHEGDYVFAAGNYDRDFRTFVEAVRPLNHPCVIACRADLLPAGIELPAHVRHVWATPEEFRQLMAGSMVVVVPMREGLLHSGGQQGFVNAMALGKAVVVSDPAGASSYITHGSTGLLVPPGVPEAMREAIQLLISNAALRREIGERAQKIAQDWAVERIYDRICAIADDVASPAAALASVSGNPASATEAETRAEANWGTGR